MKWDSGCFLCFSFIVAHLFVTQKRDKLKERLTLAEQIELSAVNLGQSGETLTVTRHCANDIMNLPKVSTTIASEEKGEKTPQIGKNVKLLKSLVEDSVAPSAPVLTPSSEEKLIKFNESTIPESVPSFQKTIVNEATEEFLESDLIPSDIVIGRTCSVESMSTGCSDTRYSQLSNLMTTHNKFWVAEFVKKSIPNSNMGQKSELDVWKVFSK